MSENLDGSRVFLYLVKDVFLGTTLVIDYRLCNVTNVTLFAEDGHMWSEGISETGKTVRVNSVCMFGNEDAAIVSAHHILEINRSMLIKLYQQLMSNLEAIDRATIVKPKYSQEF